MKSQVFGTKLIVTSPTTWITIYTTVVFTSTHVNLKGKRNMSCELILSIFPDHSSRSTRGNKSNTSESVVNPEINIIQRANST